MAITVLQPNTIWLGGPKTEINDRIAGVAICPGHLVERYNPSGALLQWRPHSTAAGGNTTRAVAVDNSMVNKGVNDGYAIGDLVNVIEGAAGTSFWMLIASGQNIAPGAMLESVGDGTLRVWASGTKLFQALEAVNNTTGNAGPTNPPPQTGGTTALPVGSARIRVEVV